jgi:hypothetical protein
MIIDLKTVDLSDYYSGWDWDLLKSFWIKDDPYQPESELYYKTKFAIANMLKPKSISEIGVRAGYSAASFLMANTTIKYRGYDLNQGTWGGEIDFTKNAEVVLDKYLVDWSISILNSQMSIGLDCGSCDLFHVDGDHSYSGCLHDIALALKTGSKWVLVDDTDFIEPVRTAVMEAIWMFNITTAFYVSDGGYRGNILLLNPDFT